MYYDLVQVSLGTIVTVSMQALNKLNRLFESLSQPFSAIVDKSDVWKYEYDNELFWAAS